MASGKQSSLDDWHQRECEIFNEQAKLFERSSVDFRRSVHFHNSTAAGHKRVSQAWTVYPEAETIALPEANRLTTGLCDIFEQRQSCRSFGAGPVSLQDMSDILSAVAVNRRTPSSLGDQIVFRKKPYPAPGGIFSIDFYVVPLDLPELTAIGHYDSDRHILSVVNRHFDIDAMKDALGIAGKFEPGPSVAILQTINMARVVVKYRQRGYRFAMIEAGLGAMALCQAATALGLGTLFWGGFKEHLLDPYLDVDGVNVSCVNTLFVGRR